MQIAVAYLILVLTLKVVPKPDLERMLFVTQETPVQVHVLEVSL